MHSGCVAMSMSLGFAGVPAKVTFPAIAADSGPGLRAREPNNRGRAVKLTVAKRIVFLSI